MASKVIKSAAWYTASNILVKALGFVTVPVFTRLLTQEEFGVYNNYLAALQLMTIVVTLSLESTIISAKKDYPDELGDYVFSMMVLSCLSAFVWLLVVNLFSGFFSTVFALNIKYLNALLIYLVFFPVVTLFQAWERFTYRYKTTVAVSVLLALGVAGISVALTLLLPDKLDGAIAGRAIPVVAIGATLFVCFLLRRHACRVSYWRYALPVALPYIPHLLAMALLGAMNKIFITRMVGAEANALYSLAYNCGQVITILVTSLNTAFSPWLGDSLAQRCYSRIRTVATPYVAAFALLAVAASLLAPEALLVLGGERYTGARYAIPPIAIGCVLQFSYCMYVNIEQYEKKTAWMAAASISAAVVNAALDILLIPSVGYLAAAWATAISFAWLMAAHMLIVRHIHMLHVYDNVAIAFSTGFACICIAASSLLYDTLAVRLLLCAGFVLAFPRFLHRFSGLKRLTDE